MNTLPELQKLLDDRGFSHDILDVTPQVSFDMRRTEEIESWLMLHPEVTSFVVLDDTLTAFKKMGQQVLTDPSTGITVSDIKKAVEILAKE